MSEGRNRGRSANAPESVCWTRFEGHQRVCDVENRLHLTKQLPAIWIEAFDDNDKAEAAREECERRADHIAAGLHLALGMIAKDARQLTLINRERDADGPGGTAHLVNVAAKGDTRRPSWTAQIAEKLKARSWFANEICSS